jgi:hypothetical protein
MNILQTFFVGLALGYRAGSNANKPVIMTDGMKEKIEAETGISQTWSSGEGTSEYDPGVGGLHVFMK